MNINIAESKNDDGSIEFYFVGLEYQEDYDVVLETLTKNPNANVIETLEGIYSRICTVELEGVKFKVIYHEDVGNYVTCVDQNEKNNKFIRGLLGNSISEIEEKIN